MIHYCITSLLQHLTADQKHRKFTIIEWEEWKYIVNKVLWSSKDGYQPKIN